jgi:hypothetical protein
MSTKLDSSCDRVAGLVSRLLKNLDTPRALTVWLLFANGEHDQLVSLEVNLDDYVDAAHYAKDYQATKLLSKGDPSILQIEIDPERAAIEKFRDTESACAATNRRLVSITRGNSPTGYHSVFHRAAQLVADCLGVLPLASVIDACGWGPGVSSSCKGERTTGYDKFTSIPEVTPDLQPVVHHVINAWHPWSSIILDSYDTETGLPLPCSVIPSALVAVKGNRVAFVPKSSKTHRAIAVEPTVNIFLQKGIGSVIRKKLRKVGVDLSDQGHNRLLAREGSVTGDLCTIDLESASDTISLELVRQLLPPDWFQLLDLARSKWGTFDGKTTFYEKFSSSGNGFTFELESLIFWAFTKAIAEELRSTLPVSIYGDDIICDRTLFYRINEIFTFLGFKINVKKSFHCGPFRESCGEDFFRGLNVRPFFIRKKPETPMEWIALANTLRQHSTRFYEGMLSNILYRDAWRYCVSMVPKKLRLFGPIQAQGVIWIHSTEKRFGTWDGHCHRVRCNDIVPRKTAGRETGGLLLAAFLYAESAATKGMFSHRRRWSVRQRTHSFPEWCEIGEWG